MILREEINCEVILIPTDKKISLIGKYPSTGALVLNLGDQDIPRGEMQEMLIVSDQKMEEGDWYYTCDGWTGEVFMTPKASLKSDGISKTIRRKIVASTERAPYLPKIPIEFVIEYANNNGNINEVAVKMEEFGSEEYHREMDYFGKTDTTLEYGIKITKNNEIIILGEAKKYSKSEVLVVLREDLKKTEENIEEYNKESLMLPIGSKERKELNEKYLSLVLLTIGIKHSIDLLKEELK